ncbi:MAG: hypothetical protein WCX31_02405 [Salinivirgaceae bacterium]|jgi:hypothetical protein
MSNLKNKSELNFAAAELLHKQSYYPSVIHCSYYSCIQLMKHIWLHKMNKTEQDLEMLTKSSTEGSHEVLINQTGGFMKNKSIDFRTFNNLMGQLKKLRVIADYKDVQIDNTVSYNSITLSKDSLLILKKCL